MNYYNLVFTRRGEEYVYTVTEEDRLNLIRAVAREGKPYDAVTWSLLQRFAWLYPDKLYANLSQFVKAYAQPINPRWFPTGSKYLARVRSLKHKYSGEVLRDKLEDEAERAENRLEYATAELDEIPAKYINVVDGVLGGSIANPVPGGVHYIASTGGSNPDVAKQKQLEWATTRDHVEAPVYYGPSTSGHNWFFSVPGSKKFKLDIIAAEQPTNLVNVGTQDSPAMALIYLLYGAAAQELAKKLKS